MLDAIESRTTSLNAAEPRNGGDYALYWMEHSQRAEANSALERAIAWANALNLPLMVLFVVDPDYPEGNARHFTFMLDGLKETIAGLRERGAGVCLRKGKPPEVAIDVAQHAAVLVTDRGYLRHLVEWRHAVARECGCLMEMVEGDVIVPVEAASPKLETAARTIRPKIHKVLEAYTALPPRQTIARPPEMSGSNADLSLDDVPAFVAGLGCDTSVAPVDSPKGGRSHAHATLEHFVDGHLGRYADGRSDIVNRHVSMLSPYLHFGQISPLEVFHAVRKADVEAKSADALVEEMVVRRELAVNFVRYNPNYDNWNGLPGWARESLTAHARDPRTAVYGPDALEQGETDDPYWNAAMKEMRITGYLHNHMRMYWGKRILGWSATPQEGFATTLWLNNKYFLDGRDCNSYANVGWLYGVHDRGWPERDVYGKVRIMMPSGLKRKFDVNAYVRWAESL